MSLLQHTFFPRSVFDMDQWYRAPYQGPSTLDLFDPFDELDNTISRNLHWLNKPEFLKLVPLFPKVPQKYRITVDCSGYSPNSIKTDIKNDKLVVYGREEHKEESDDFSIREFKKTYELPPNCEKDKLVTFVAAGGKLVIEVPLKETDISPNKDLFPRIVDNQDGSKTVNVKFNIPKNIDPSKVSVSVKDRDIIFRAEDKVTKPDKLSNFYYYKRTTLPENTEFNKLKCIQDKNEISVSAPLDLDYTRSYSSIPIETKSSSHEHILQPQKCVQHEHHKAVKK